MIVGGGLAGLAAASALAGRGLSLTVLESRPRLGGRASSFTDPATGRLVDNSQHVSMGCCTNLAAFARKVGIRHLFRPLPRLLMLDPEGDPSELAAGWLPAPFHLTGSLLRARYLSWRDKVALGYALACLRIDSEGRPGEPFGTWLRRHGQSPRAMARFWETTLVATLNETLDRMDYRLARMVVLDGLLRNRHGFVVEVPEVPLGELYGERLEPWFRERGIELRRGCGVRRVVLDAEGIVSGVELREGTEVAADLVVLAVPFQRVQALWPEGQVWPALEGPSAMKPSPITGVHLWFDRKVFPLEHAALLERLSQWVFDHTAMDRPTAEAGGQYLQVVISASHGLLSKTKDEIRSAVLADLTELWPAVREAVVERSWIVTEHAATFAVPPGIASLRPPQRTPVSGLYVAGDWTDTGWPATMEGAVRSGFLAAEELLTDLGTPERLLVPDLPTGWIARLLLGAPRSGTRSADSGCSGCSEGRRGAPLAARS